MHKLESHKDARAIAKDLFAKYWRGEIDSKHVTTSIAALNFLRKSCTTDRLEQMAQGITPHVDF
jgi:hypothetical protein